MQPDDFDNSSNGDFIPNDLTTQQALAAISSLQSPQNTAVLLKARSTVKPLTSQAISVKPRALLLILVAIAITIVGLAINNWIVGIVGTVVTLLLSLAAIWLGCKNCKKSGFQPKNKP